MRQRLGGQTALVTGASRGLGAAVAKTLAQHGARVAAVARTLDAADEQAGSLAQTVEGIRGAGGEAAAFAADLSDPENCDDLYVRVAAEVGAPTILINCAAVTFLRPLADFPLRRVQVMLNLHLLTPLRLAQLVAPGMRTHGCGWILNITSVAATQPEGPPFSDFDATAGFAVYGTVKSALDRLTGSLAAELHADNIAVNAAAPLLPVRTPGAAALDLAQTGTEEIDLICRTALELCSGDPSVLTGRVAYTTPFLTALDAGEIAGANTADTIN